MRFCKIVCLVLLPILLGGCIWDETESSPEYLVMDDSQYPYAGLPRVVIETKDFGELRDRETFLDAHLQVYGKKAPESGVMELKVRGRGNSSFKMPKYGMKLKFPNKVSMFGMPENKEWALVGNFGDKTYLRNYMMYRLSEWLGAAYTPKMCFVELYLNRKYMGLYLLSETVKAGKNRVNIPKDETSFLLEKESSNKYDDPFVKTNSGYIFHINSPKDPSPEAMDLVVEHLNDFEDQLFRNHFVGENIEDWVDLDALALYYWVQEYSKNEDGNFLRSIFFTWQVGGPVRFGPLWDFDLAFGNASRESVKPYDEWYIRTNKWCSSLYGMSEVKEKFKSYWLENRATFAALIDSVPLYRSMIEPAVKNELKRWPIMSNTENWALKEPYGSYDEAVEAMVNWMKARHKWIDENL